MAAPLVLSPLWAAGLAGAQGLFDTFLGMNNKNAQARQQNEARIQQYKQQMLIRDVKDQQRFGVYNTKKVEYEQNLNALTRRFGYQDKAQQLRMAELMKGSKLASQNDLINQVEKAGKVMASTSSGVSQAKLRQSAMAKIGRATAARKATLEGQQAAFEMEREARILSLDTARQNAFNKVRYAPQQSVQMLPPTMMEGANSFDLIAGIGGAALGAAGAYMEQDNFKKSLLVGNPKDATPS